MTSRPSLVRRLTVSFLVPSTAVLLLVVGLVYSRAAAVLETTAFDKLQTIADVKGQALDDWVNGLLDQLDAVGRTLRFHRAFRWGDIDDDAALAELLQAVADGQPSFGEILLFSPTGGEILVSTNPNDIGKHFVYSQFYVEGRKGRFIQDVYPSPETLRPRITLSTPIFSQDNSLAAVLAAHLSLSYLDRQILQKQGLGKSGVVTLVDQHRILITGNRYGMLVPSQEETTVAIEEVVRGKDGYGVYRNLDGENVLGVYNWLPRRNLGFIVEMDESEALADARKLAVSVLWVGTIFLLVLASGIIFMARRIARPILAISSVAALVRDGELAKRAPVMTRDEIGHLAESFNQMIERLNETVLQLEENNSNLNREIEARQRLENDREELLEEIESYRRDSAEQSPPALRRADQEELLIKLLRADNPAHLAALRDELRAVEKRLPTSESSPATMKSFQEKDFFAGLRQIVEGLEPLERLAGEDRSVALGKALTKALSMQEQMPGGAPVLDGLALESVRDVFVSALRDIQQRAELQMSLHSNLLTIRREAVVALKLENTGAGSANDVEVRLRSSDALIVHEPQKFLSSLGPGQTARLEFSVEPQQSERFRLSFEVNYSDPERAGKTKEFADVVEFRRFAQPDVFRPLLPNPYVVGRPLGEDDPFFGREDLFMRLSSSLQGATQDNIVVLIGQRRMGKTSILRRLHEYLPASYVPVFIDLQGFLGDGEGAFFDELIAQIVDELEEVGIRLPQIESRQLEKRPGHYFRRKFLPMIREIIGHHRLLLLFDEMEVLEERIRSGDLTPKFLPYLRSLMQHEENLSFLLAGTHRLNELTADYWGVLFNLAVYIEVGHLTEEDVKELILRPTRESFEVDSLALDMIYRMTGGHPYYSQLLARELVELCNRERLSYVTVQNAHQVVDIVVDKGQLHIKHQWDQSTHDERVLLLTIKDLLGRDGIASMASVQQALYARDLKLIDVPHAVKRLQRREILAAEARQLTFKVDLLRRWLDRHQHFGLEHLGNDALNRPSDS